MHAFAGGRPYVEGSLVLLGK